MLRIEHRGNKLRVRSSNPGSGMRGWKLDVRTPEDAARVVLHYYGSRHNKSRCDACKDVKLHT